MGKTIPQEALGRLFALYQRGHLAEVVTVGTDLAKRYPRAAIVHTLIGAANAGLWQREAAAAAFGRAAAIDTQSAEAHNNYASALKELGQLDKAAQAYARALALAPGLLQAHYNLGLVRFEQGRIHDAVRSQERAVACDAGFAPAYAQLGLLLGTLGRMPEALAAYERALALAPSLGTARAEKLLLQLNMADWRGFDEFALHAETLGIAGEPVNPFTLLPYDDDPARQRQRAEHAVAATVRREPMPLVPPPPAADGRLRVGYFSADFHDHATMYLMAGLFRAHDRSRLAIHAYSYGTPRNEAMRDHLTTHAEHFFDVHGLDDRAIAMLAREHGLDIAVDLKGYTLQARLDPFALRLAPVQIGYLGYPGTTGARFIDYIIGDAVVIPPADHSHYTEAVITLAGCYQINDAPGVPPAPAEGRAAHGLPERGADGQGFVFCSFNNTYKISPTEFAIWMRLLQQVDGAVLWLLRTNAWAEDNLRAAARAHGIDPARLVFAGRVSHADNLARHAHADLFLDCFAVNAHTTASDALRCGLPLITLAGRSFAARVAASLLTSVGLPELIADSAEAYEALALALARDPVRLAALRARLQQAAQTVPLFDPEATTRKLEAAYFAAHARARDGLPPAPFTIG